VIGDLEERSPGDVEELGEFAMAIPSKAFCDIARDGAHGSAELIAKTPIIDRSPFGSKCMDLIAELIGKLPGTQLLNGLRTHA